MLLILVGVLLRVVRYLHNRALWGDEAALALNIMHRSPRELLDPLDFDQAAPVLFLLGEKGVTSALGYSEPALRALPLIAGILSLPLFWSIAKRVLEPIGAIIALAFFAVSDPLVFYSAEAKQYGIDVMIALLLLFLLLPVLQEHKLSRGRACLLLFTGTAAVWASHPSVFLLACSGLIMSWLAMREPHRVTWTRVAPVISAWAVSFLASYIFVLPNTRTVRDELGLSGPADAVASAASGHTTVFRAVATATWDSFAYPLGAAATVTGLVAVMLVVGFWGMLRATPLVALALGGPGVLAIATALANRYPWGDRFVLFLVPIVILFVAGGLDELRRRTWHRLPILTAASMAVVLAYPFAVAAGGVIAPAKIKRQEIKEPLALLQARWRSGDTLYVHEIAQYALRYYAECSECDVLNGWEKRLQAWGALEQIGAESNFDPTALRSRPPQLLVGEGQRPNVAALTEQLEPLRGRERVWLLFSTTTNTDALVYLLDGWGRQLELQARSEAAVYLYDLSTPER